jgi:hypothetical protein
MAEPKIETMTFRIVMAMKNKSQSSQLALYAGLIHEAIVHRNFVAVDLDTLNSAFQSSFLLAFTAHSERWRHSSHSGLHW